MNMKDINFISLDLENNKYTGSIIQIGAVVGNLKSGEILEEYSAYIKVNELVDEYITNLTGIKQNDVDSGIFLEESYAELKVLHKKYDCFRNCLTWGGGDSAELRKQLNLDDEVFLFGRRWIDVKTIYISIMFAKDKKTQAGLAKALLNLSMFFKGKKHNARDDARNTFYIYHKMLTEISKLKD